MDAEKMFKGALPVAAGVLLAGVAMYFLGGKVPGIREAQKGFDGHNSDSLIFN